MSPDPALSRLVVVCRVSTHCNLRCGFCAYDRRLGFARQTLSDARVEHLIQLMSQQHRQHGGVPPLLSWLGGEPLLWPRWPHFSQRAREHGLAVSATTNASTLWRPQTRADVLACLTELTLSVDAVGAQHDILRGWRGGYARTLAALRALVDERGERADRLRLRANIVLMRSTIDQFELLTAALAAAGIDEISFNLLGGRDRPEFHAREAVPVPAWDAFVRQHPRIRAALAQSGVTLTGDADYLLRLGAAARSHAWPVADCAPGERFLFVDERGVVAPCAFTAPDYGLPLEHIDDLDQLPLHFRVAQTSRCAKACADCPSTQVFGKFGSAHITHNGTAQVVDLNDEAAVTAGDCA